MTVSFYLLGNDCCSGLLSLIWAPPCLLLSRRSQEQGPCFSQTNTPTACFLLLLEAELSKAFRKTWSYLQKAWEQATCFPRAFWLAIRWCGWRPPPSSRRFPVKVKHPMLKGKKKLPANSKQPQNTIRYYFIQHQSITDHYMDYFKENKPWTWYWKHMISGFLPSALHTSPANPKVSDELRALYLEASGQGIL